MLTKGFKDLLAEANAVVDVIAVHDAVDLHGGDEVVFVDVREPEERAKGTIPNSVHAPRGFIEFIADPEGPMHNSAFASGKKLVLFCGTGARSAMAAKTLDEMGFGNVVNMAGGIQAWVRAGGAVTR
jgi:rhodanese-related sulfurtransferase